MKQGATFSEDRKVSYKHIFIQQTKGEQFEGYPVYRVYNKKIGDQIGIISWYRPWKKYVFSSIPECVFDLACLCNIVDFLENKIG